MITQWLECFSRWDTLHQMIFSVIVILSLLMAMMLAGFWALLFLRSLADLFKKSTPSAQQVVSMPHIDVEARAVRRAARRAERRALPPQEKQAWRELSARYDAENGSQSQDQARLPGASTPGENGEDTRAKEAR